MKNSIKHSLMSAVIVVAAATSFAEGSYPVAIMDRPGSLDLGQVEVIGEFDTKPTASAVDPTLSAKVKVGVGKGFQLNLAYDGLNMGNMEVSEVFHVGMRRSLLSVGDYSMSTSFDLPIHFKGQAIQNVRAGLSQGYLFTEGLAISALRGKLVDVKFGPKVELELNVPVELAFQATENVYLELGTNFANLHTQNMKASSYIWTKTPVDFSVTYAFNNIVDVSVKAGFENAQKPKDTFVAGLGVAFRAGDLG